MPKIMTNKIRCRYSLLGLCWLLLAATGSANDLNALFGSRFAVMDQQARSNVLAGLDAEIHHNPTNYVYQMQKATVLIQTGQFDAALLVCDNLIQNYNKDLGLSLRGYAYYGREDYDKAVFDFTEVLHARPVADIYLVRGRAYEFTGDYQSALGDYGNVIKLNGNDSRAYYYRSGCYVYFGKINNAISDLSQALQLSSVKPATVFAERGELYFLKGDYTRAMADYDQALRLDPNCVEALNNYAWLLAVCPDPQIRKGQKSVEYATKVCKLILWKDPNCLATLAAACAEAGDYAAAVEWQTKAIKGGAPDGSLKTAGQILQLYNQHKPYRVQPLVSN